MFEFWLKNETKGVSLMLPVTPEGYENSIEREIEKVRATEKGDVNVLGKMKPQSFPISGFFPENDYSFARDPNMGVNCAMDYIDLLEGWVRDGDIIRVVVADDRGAKINGQYHLARVQYGSKKEDNGDIPYTLYFEEYTPMNVATVSKGSAQSTSRADTAAIPPKAANYTVKSGDSLSAIARQVYGDANQWKKIYEANKSIIGNNPNLIYPGQTYTIP